MKQIALWIAVVGLGVAGVGTSLPEARLVTQVGGRATSLAPWGSFALVGQGRRLVVVDVLNPAYPRQVATVSLKDVVRTIVVDGNRALVVLERDAVLVDLRDPGAPEVTATLPGAFVTAVWAGDLVVGLAEQSFTVFQAADLHRPQFQAYLPDSSLRGGKWAAARDGRLLVADSEGIHVYSLALPSAPRLEHRFRWREPLIGLRDGLLLGNTLYLAVGRTVWVYDLSDPARPREVRARELPLPVVGFLPLGTEVLALTDVSSLYAVTAGRAEEATPRFSPPFPVGRAIAGFTVPGWLGVLTEDHGLRFYRWPGAGSPTPQVTTPTPAPTGHVEPNPSFDVALRAGWAYVAAGDRGLALFRVSGPNLEPMGRVAIPEGGAHGLALVGEWLCVASGPAGLTTLSLANPGAPAVRGRIPLSGHARAVTVQGGFAFVAAGHAGVQVVDLRDPARPQLVGQAVVPGYAWDAAPKDHWLLVAAGHEGLRVVDLSNPSAPRDGGGLPLPGTAWAIRIAGDWACVALGFGGVAVVDVSDPRRPQLVRHLPLPGFAARVTWDGDQVLIATEWGGVRVLDLRDPTRPRELGYHAIPGGGWAKGAARAGDWLYVVGTGVHAFPARAAAGRPPEPVIPVENAFFIPPGQVTEVAVVEGLLYAVDGAGICVFQLEPPEEPRFPAFVPHPRAGIWGPPQRLVAHGGRLFVTGGTWLDVWTLDRQGLPVLAAQLPVGGSDMALVDDHLYLTAHDALLVVDVRTPDRTTVRARLPWDGLPRSVSALGSLLLVGNTRRNGVHVLRIEAPGVLREVAFHSTTRPPYTQSPQAIVGVGNYALLSVGSRGLVLLDLSRPSEPRELREVRLLMSPSRMVIHGDLLIASTSTGDVLLFDASNLPALEGRWNAATAAGSSRGVAVADGFLYVGFAEGGLAVFRLTPARP